MNSLWISAPIVAIGLLAGLSGPEGKEDQWVRTVPGKGFAVMLRLYGPVETWFDKTWNPTDLEQVR